jgi:hypothetical protein
VTDREQPRIGPFSLQVPPPSTNGHRPSRSTLLEPVRRSAPGFVVGVVLCVSTIPRIALLHTAHFAYWWRILIASAIGGLVTGIVQRSSAFVAAVAGAVVSIAGLLLAYTVVRGEVAEQATVGRVVADVGGLVAWGIAGGAVFAVAGWAFRRAFTAKRAAVR